MNSEGDSARSPVAGAGGGPANLLDALKGMWPIARRANSGTLSQPSAASGRPVPAEARAPEPAPEPPEQLRPRAHSQPQQWNGNSAIALAGAADVLSQRRPSEPSNQPPFTGFTIQPLPVFPALSMPVAVVPPTHGTGGGIVQRYIPTQTMLGHGAWGSARLILRGADHRPFALKEFKKKPGDDEVPGRYERRCAHEFHSLSLLRHPNIVGVIEFEYDPRTQAAGLVLELVTGGDLYTAISSNTLTNQREIDCLFGQIVRAVAYMHSRGVAHRDLKPENMLWEPMTGCLKIIDFGSAEVFGPPLPTSGPADPEDVAFFAENQVAPEDIAVVNGRRIKLSRNVVGSAPYIAPEEFLGAGYDARGADVWACAIIYLVRLPWIDRLFHYLLTTFFFSGDVHAQIPLADGNEIRRPLPPLSHPRLPARSRPIAASEPKNNLPDASTGSDKACDDRGGHGGLVVSTFGRLPDHESVKEARSPGVCGGSGN